MSVNKIFSTGNFNTAGGAVCRIAKGGDTTYELHRNTNLYFNPSGAVLMQDSAGKNFYGSGTVSSGSLTTVFDSRTHGSALDIFNITTAGAARLYVNSTGGTPIQMTGGQTLSFSTTLVTSAYLLTTASVGYSAYGLPPIDRTKI